MNDKIVFIIGAPRSGTTILGDLLSADDRFFYTGEIPFVWNYGSEFSSSELIRSFSEKQKAYIRKWFEKFASKEGSEYILEKTPSNCLRVAAIRQVFPNARFIHIIRDGRDVIQSAKKERMGFSADSLDSSELRSLTPLRRLIAIFRRKSRLRERVTNLRSFVGLFFLIPSIFRLFGRSFCPGKSYQWGVRIPGYKALQNELTVEEVCALQWECCIKFARCDLRDLSPAQLIEIRYEDLIERPKGVLTRISEFCGWEPNQHILENVASKVISREASDEGHIGNSEGKYVSLIRSTLKDLGYIV